MYGKVGEITTVNTSELTARVKFEDSDDMISEPMQWLITSQEWVPKVGQFVYCGYTVQKKGYILGVLPE